MAGVACSASCSFTSSCAGTGFALGKSNFRVTPARDSSNCNVWTSGRYSRQTIGSKSSDRNESASRAVICSCTATTYELRRERHTAINSSCLLSNWTVASGVVGDDPVVTRLGSSSRDGHDGLVELISSQNSEPEWMLQFRQGAYKQWVAMERPEWAADEFHPAIDVDRELQLHTVASVLSKKKQQQNVDIEGAANISTTNILDRRFASAGFGSVSFATEHREALKDAGVIFCSFRDAIREHPELVKKYLGKVIDVADNYYAALNSAVFRDGLFCYVPKDTVCPMDISTYFLSDAGNDQINDNFERILIVCDENSSVSYLGCTSPSARGSRGSSQQLQAPVVELYCARGAEIKFSTIQNWDPTVHNFVNKSGLCDGPDSKISWVQIDMGSAVTRQRPHVVLRGDRSSAEFFTATLTDAQQRADVGACVVHAGENTSSRLVARAIGAGSSNNSYHHLCQVLASASDATSTLDCECMLIGDHASSEVIPSISVRNSSAQIQQDIRETSNVLGKEQLFYCEQRGISSKEVVAAMVQAFCMQVIDILPYEFASEVSHMMGLKMEDALGAV